jgi:hypothetical protein
MWWCETVNTHVDLHFLFATYTGAVDFAVLDLCDTTPATAGASFEIQLLHSGVTLRQGSIR